LETSRPTTACHRARSLRGTAVDQKGSSSVSVSLVRIASEHWINPTGRFAVCRARTTTLLPELGRSRARGGGPQGSSRHLLMGVARGGIATSGSVIWATQRPIAAAIDRLASVDQLGVGFVGGLETALAV
jgi:hypothetical protein